MKPTAYAPTHLLLRARPSARPTSGRGQRHDPPPSPDAEVDRCEEGRGDDDERRHVRVVHGDARVGERHPFDQDEHRGDDRDTPAPEQDAREQIDGARHERAHDHTGEAPCQRVRADVDAGDRSSGRQRQQVLAIVGRTLRLIVEDERRRVEGEPCIGEDRVGMRLDDVHRLATPVGRLAEGMDEVARSVPGQRRDRTRASPACSGRRGRHRAPGWSGASSRPTRRGSDRRDLRPASSPSPTRRYPPRRTRPGSRCRRGGRRSPRRWRGPGAVRW